MKRMSFCARIWAALATFCTRRYAAAVYRCNDEADRAGA